jgi:hypothetical protein
MVMIARKLTNVPEEDRFGNTTMVKNTERGWREFIFHKIGSSLWIWNLKIQL